MDGSRAPMASAGIETGGEGRNSPASPKFPVGLRVLVVDDDANYLKIMERMLHHCLYNVTSCTRAAAALSILRERKGGFDIVLSDVHMPDMDGFKLLELIGLEMDLPVIMVSADDNKDVVMKGVTHGACDYLIKPVRMNALKNIWQHVIRKKRSGSKEFEHSGSTEDDDKQKRPSDEVENASSPNEGNSTNVKRKKEGKEEEGDVEEQEDYSAQKKPRVVWSSDLHQSFVTAVDQLGIEKAVPTKILDLMNKPWLTRENVASHLQKYRLYLRRVCGPQYQGQSESPFMGDTDSGFGFGNSLDGFDLQSLGVPAQFPSQRLTTANAGSRTYANVDQISFCNSDVQVVNSPRMRSSAGQLLSNKQFGLLWGASSNIGSSLSQQSSQSFGDMGLQATKGTSDCLNLSSSARTNFLFPGTNVYGQLGNGYGLQMTPQGQYTSLSHQQNNIQIGMQYQPRLRGLTGSHNSTVPSLLPAYQNVAYGAVPQAQYADFSSCRNHDAGTGSYCPLVSSIGAPNRIFAGKVEAMSDTMSSKGVNDSIHSHDLHNELCRSKSQKWELHNSNLPYESTQSLGSKQTNGDFGSAITNLSYSNDHGGRKEEISVGTETERKVGCISQHINTVPIEDNVGVKHESIPYSNCLDELFAENFPPDMAIMRIQDQEGFAQCESEFNFSCSLDDIEV